MKYLILLRGSPAVGKSTWIEENTLQQYTISADNLRLLHQSPSTQPDGSVLISPNNDKKVWKLLYELVEERMTRGELTIVDATHSRAQAINAYKDMCVEHRYRCFVIDFTEEASLEEILKRNRERASYKFVPEDAIRNISERLKHDSVPSWAKVLKPKDFNDLTRLRYDYNALYNRVVVFGDVHSSWTPLKQYFDENPFDEKTKYIFVGDLFDRGHEAVEVFNFLYQNKDTHNFLFVAGNHELHLYDYVYDRPVKSKDARETIEFLTASGIDKAKVKKLMERFAQFAYFDFKDKAYCITHGGIPNAPNIFTPSIEYIRGVGKYEDSEIVDEAWCNNTAQDHYSIHGHRNIFNVPPKNTERTYNLNGSPEYGDDLVILELTKDQEKIIKIKNTNAREQNKEVISNGNQGMAKFLKNSDITPSNRSIAELLAHGGVKVKELKDGIFSVNFDKKIFYRKTWDSVNIKARGLFIDKDSNVVARSYQKFFNLNERDETKLISLSKNLKFPVVAYEKENGFLGILSVYNNEFFVASKSTNEGEFKEYFNELIKPYFSEELKSFLETNKVSMVFEVIDVQNDPHIVEYSKSDVILLDIIYNDLEYRKFSYEELIKTAVSFEFEYKKEYCVYNTFQELSDDIQKIQSRDELTPDIEGYVFEDANNYAFKVKGNYYNFWKRQRHYFEVYKKQGMTNQTKKMLHSTNDFVVWNKLIDNPVDFTKSLIQIRKELGFK